VPTDFYPLLSKAVSALEPNTAETRRDVYEQARQLLSKHLASAIPTVAEAGRRAQQTALESAIEQIEREAAPADTIEERASVLPPAAITAEYLLPGEPLIFASADAISWRAMRGRATQGELNQSFMRGSVTGVPGAGAMAETNTLMARSRKQWVATKIKWVLLTDRRLLLVSEKTGAKIFELDPSVIKDWIKSEPEITAKVNEAMRESRRKRGVLGLLGVGMSADIKSAIPERIYTISGATTQWHLFRRQGSPLGCGLFILGILILFGLLALGVSAGAWLVIAFVAILCGARIGPWTGVRLRVVLMQWGTPKVFQSLTNWVISRDEIQFLTPEDAELFVRLLGPRAKAIADALM
jgi:hypothetical protein